MYTMPNMYIVVLQSTTYFSKTSYCRCLQIISSEQSETTKKKKENLFISKRWGEKREKKCLFFVREWRIWNSHELLIFPSPLEDNLTENKSLTEEIFRNKIIYGEKKAFHDQTCFLFVFRPTLILSMQRNTIPYKSLIIINKFDSSSNLMLSNMTPYSDYAYFEHATEHNDVYCDQS